MRFPPIPSSLTLEDLTDEQHEVFLALYERSEQALTRKPHQKWKPYVATFVPLSAEQRVECELWNLGLIARVPANPSGDGLAYGYAMSVFGHEWFVKQSITPRMRGDERDE